MLTSTRVFQYKNTIKNFIICLSALVIFAGGVFTYAQSTNTINNVIDGYVWQDSNANGLQDNGEIPLSNVAVNLVDSQHTVIASTTTASDGHYTFTSIPYGEFTVQFGTLADHQLTPKDANNNSSDAIDSDVASTTGVGDLFTFAEYDRAFKTLEHYDMNEIITDPAAGCSGLSGTALTDCMAQHQAMRYASFRYSLQEASYPTTIEQNDSIQTVMKWFNIGFAPSYPALGQNFSVHLYFVDTNGNVVLESTPSANIATWLPATNGAQAPENIVLDTMLITDSIPVGTYTLQVAIVDDLTGQPILIDPKTEGQMGRYILDTINVIAESNGSTETIDAGYVPIAQPTPLSIDIDQSTLTIQAETTAMNTGYVNGIETTDYSLDASLGSVELLSDGSWMWLYSPTNDDAGEQTVILTANDGADKTEEAQFTVSVLPLQSAPPKNPPADLVFSTDFEDVTKVNNHHLSLPISHWFEFGGNGGATFWMDNQITHSGNRSLGMSITDITKSERNEFDIMNMDELVGDEASVSVWMYFPEDYNQNVPGINWNWHEFLVLYSHDSPGLPRPYLRLIVSQPDITKKEFKVSLGGRDSVKKANGSDGYLYGEINPFDFPRGRWFNVHYYLKRHNTDGVVKVWIDGKLVFDINGVRTKEATDYGYKMTVAKLYFETSEPNDQFIWVDDLSIYRGYVEPGGASEPKPNIPLVVNVDQSSVSTNEGGTAVNTGSLSGFQSKNFTVEASVGTVDVMTDGSWIWNHVTSDNVNNQQVTITAQDGNKTSQATFTYSATNLAPTALFSAGATTVTTGSPVTLQFTNINDAGQADINAGMTYHYDCTNDGATDITSGNPSATCTYDIAGQYTVAGRIQDKDGAFSDYSVNITVQQSQSAPPKNPPADLVFSTDFENVVKTDNHHLNLPISHWFEFDGNGGADVWMETQNAHSGNRSLGMSLTDIKKSGRNEFDIMNMDELVGDEASVSVWMYFPEDYNQNVPGINWNWHEFLVLYSHDNPGAPLPYLRLIVSQPDITKKQFKLSLGGRDNIINANGSNGYSYGEINPFDFPRGRWFNVHYYLKRHNTDGVVKVWVDGNLVFNINGVKTKEKTDYGYKMTVAKLYFETNEPKDQFIWVDDLSIYRGYVEPGGATNPQPTKPAPAPTQAPTNTPAPTQTPQDVPPRSTPTPPTIADYVAFGLEEVIVQNQTRIVNGAIGANSKVILNDLTKALDGQTIVIANQVVLRDNVSVPYAMYNKLIGNESGAVQSVTSIKIPVLNNLPSMPAIMPGSENVTGNSNNTLTIDAGNYGVLFAKANSTIVLTGGVYHFSSVDLRKNAQLIVTAPTEIRVADKFKTVTGVYVGPQAGSGLDARHLVIYVNGINGTGGAKSDAPKAFQTGTVNTIHANIYTPNGTVKIGNDSNASGSYFGKWIIIGANSQISRTSVWGTSFNYSTYGTQAMMMQSSAVQLSAPQTEIEGTSLKVEPTVVIPTVEIAPTEEAPAVEIIETEVPVDPSPTIEIIPTEMPTEVVPTAEIVPTVMPTQAPPTAEIIPTEVIPTVEIIPTEMPTEVVPEATQEPSG